MLTSEMTRRNYLAWCGAGAASAAALGCARREPTTGAEAGAQGPPPDHERRIAWWREARFGTFVCLGLYSILGRHEWVMENEGIPLPEYEPLAQKFNPKPGAPREWAKLAKSAGMKYIVFLTKHHDGYCLFDSKLTSYCSTKTGPRRDLTAEYVEAMRAEGMRIGLYHSLMDWHHPDGARCAENEDARRRFVDYVHGQIREILTNYGKIDILWYDVPWPLDAAGWESQKMNDMALTLQPDIIVNNRNRLPGDFGTPEQHIVADEKGDWEACMTMNESWGYQAADDAWKTPKTSLRNLITCARDGGNFLYNLGPRADGSIPEESVRVLNKVGDWMSRNGQTIYSAERCKVRRSNYANFTRKGNTLYVHVYFWPGETVTVGGLRTKVKSATLLATGKSVNVKQDEFRVQFTGLPTKAPDDPITVIAAECESEPVQDMILVRGSHSRGRTA